MLPIPSNGTSLPLVFTLPYAPASSLLIKMTLSSTSPNLTYDK